MSIKVGQKGDPLRISTNGFDMSGSTGLEIEFTRQDGTTVIYDETTTPAVTAPAVALVNDKFLGNQPASTYFELISIVATFDAEGNWTACANYEDATTLVYADVVEFEVLPKCYNPLT